VPAVLAALAGGIVLVALFGLDDHGVALIAEVPRGLPAPGVPAFGHVDALLPWAIAIALLAHLETVSAARSIRRPDDPSVDDDQELVANGVGAVAGAFFGTLPPAGGRSRSTADERVGARTQVSALVTVGLAVAAALLLGPVLGDLPRATLAALVIVAVLGLIRPAELALLARCDRVELLAAVLVVLVALTAGLLVAVAVGVAANLLLVLREGGQVDVDELRPLADGSLMPVSSLASDPLGGPHASGAPTSSMSGSPATAALPWSSPGSGAPDAAASVGAPVPPPWTPSRSGAARWSGASASGFVEASSPATSPAVAAAAAASQVARATSDRSVLAATAAAWSDPLPGLLVLRIGVPRYTANVRGVQAGIRDRVAATDPRPEVVVVEALVADHPPVIGVAVLRELDRELADQGIELWIAALPGAERLAVGERLHPTATAAVAAYRARMGHWARADRPDRANGT
jgi:MFS superfamily sulfate permease-like transporter